MIKFYHLQKKACSHWR